jgi:hypothetical protein
MKNSRDKRTPKGKSQGTTSLSKNIKKPSDRVFFDNLSDSYTVSDSITSATAGDDHSIWIGEGKIKLVSASVNHDRDKTYGVPVFFLLSNFFSNRRSLRIPPDETDITTPTTDASNTTVKQSRLLIDAIDAASEVPNEKNSSKRVRHRILLIYCISFF